MAHWRASDNEPQTLVQHLLGVAQHSRSFASKIGLQDAGELIGALYDLGKYSKEFQDYLCSAVGLLDVDADDYVDAKGLKGKVDHSSVRGPVTIQSAFSVERIDIESTQIVKSTSLEGNGEKRQSDQMGMKHRIDRGVYVTFGSINPQLAERTGFSDTDADVLKTILPKLFQNDASSARPDGSMEVLKVIWWQHNSKSGQHSSAKVHRSITVKPDGSIGRADLVGLTPEVIDGF